ncbi:MAG: lipopolysaccharide heptosyltransferase II [Burkholderiaceae bacterium]
MRSPLIAPNWIGDAVMAQPLTDLIRAHHGGGLDAVAAPHVAPVLRAMSAIDEVIELPLRRGSLQLGDRWRLARRLRSSAYARCYVLPNNLKAAIAPWLAGIPERVGHRGEARYGLINRMHKGADARDRLMVEFYAQLITVTGASLPAQIAEPRLRVAAGLLQQCREKFLPDGAEPLIAFAPGAEYGPAKRWPARHFAALAGRIQSQWPHARIVLLGAAKERDLATEITTLSGLRLLNLCGNTRLEEAMALIALSDAVVTNDSGLMHVAAALRRPVVALFGSSDPRHTPPLAADARVLWLQLDCSPCFARTCPLGHTDCLNRLTPAMAMQALQAALADRSPSPELGSL